MGAMARVLVFFLASAAFCWQLFLPGRVLLPADPGAIAPWTELRRDANGPSNPLGMDGLILTLPARLYNHSMLRSGRIPFWNPHVFCGYPHLALIQNNVLYPLSLPFDLAAPAAGIGYSLFLHLGLAGSLMFLFLRRAGLEPSAAILGGLAFEFNGMFLLRLSVPSYVYSGTWLPLLLIGVDRLARGGRLREGWPVIAGTALSILGGHPQITSFVLIITVIYWAWRVSSEGWGSTGRHPLEAVGGLALLVAGGACIAAYQLLPFVELLGQSSRAAIPLSLYRRSALPVVGLLQAFLPDVFGHPTDGSYAFDRWGHFFDGVPDETGVWGFNYIGENLYTGLPTLVLALFAVARSRRAETLLWSGLALGSLAVVLGTPLIDVAYWLVPGMRYSRPDRVLYVYMVAVPILAALGFEAARPETPERRPGAGYLLLRLLGGIVLAWCVAPVLVSGAGRARLFGWLAEVRRFWGLPASHLLEQAEIAFAELLATGVVLAGRRSGRAPRAAAGLAWLLVVAPNLLFGWHFNPVHRPPPLGETPAEKLLVEGRSRGRIARILSPTTSYLPANTAQMLGLDDIQGGSALVLADYVRLIRALDPAAVTLDKYFDAFRDPFVASSPVLDLLGVEHVLSDQPLPLPRVLAARSGGVSIYRNPRALPRFFIVTEAEPHADGPEALRRLVSADFDPRRIALVEPGTVPTAGPPAPSKVEVESEEPHELRLRVTAPSGGVLVSSDVFYPGWEGRVDGAPVRALRVNTAFLGVAVPPGRHDVRFVFVPRSFYIGLAISGLTLLLVALAWGRVTRVTRTLGAHE